MCHFFLFSSSGGVGVVTFSLRFCTTNTHTRTHTHVFRQALGVFVSSKVVLSHLAVVFWGVMWRHLAAASINWPDKKDRGWKRWRGCRRAYRQRTHPKPPTKWAVREVFVRNSSKRGGRSSGRPEHLLSEPRTRQAGLLVRLHTDRR